VLVVDDDRVFRVAASRLLENAGYAVEAAGDAEEALAALVRQPADVLLLDVGLPGRSGLEVLAEIRALPGAPRVVVVTADDTPGIVLRAMRGQADRFLTKPFPPSAIAEIVSEVIAASPAAELPIDVISARPEWVELVVPCALEVANRVQPFMLQLEADLPDTIRESVGQAFRELLNNAIEWGGKLDPTRKVRIACLRTRRLLLYRIADPGEGFDIDGIRHAAICNPTDNPVEHAVVREEMGLRPGGLGLMMTFALVDDLVYNEARNEVVFVKYLDDGAEREEKGGPGA
jgi:CheY-like chemotaxis protein/anti-sigma regulatory factor (Ser/Thr protein kinase)